MVDKEWRHGVFGIPTVMSSFMISEMAIALILLINFCIFLFCVSGAHETNKQYNRDDIISESELKKIEDEIKQVQKDHARSRETTSLS